MAKGRSKNRSYSQSSISPTRFEPLTWDKIKVGTILWLPPVEEVIASLRLRGGDDTSAASDWFTGEAGEDGLYNHPIVVLSHSSNSPYTIHFQIITSFGGKSLEQRFSGQYQWQRAENYVPIFHLPDPSLYSDRVLKLRRGAVMAARSYVKISKVYKIDWRGLRPYRGESSTNRTSWKLDRQSIERLLVLATSSSNYDPDLVAQQLAAPSPTLSDISVAESLVLRESLAKPMHTTRTRPVERAAARKGRSVEWLQPTTSWQESSSVTPSPTSDDQGYHSTPPAFEETRPLLRDNNAKAHESHDEDRSFWSPWGKVWSTVKRTVLDIFGILFPYWD